MCSKNRISNKFILGYSYPTLHTGKKWYVDFYILDPATGSFKRKKYHLDNIPKVSERRKQANLLIELLTRKLNEGWNPFVDAESNRAYIELCTILDKYIDFVNKSRRTKTVHSYTSRVNVLREYMNTLPIPPRYAYQYDSRLISGFLDWIYLDRDCGARTYNNYRNWCYSLADFMVQRKYINENPVAIIPKMQEGEKRRKDLSARQLSEMRRHLMEQDKHFLLACMFEYFTFIRPTELSYVQIKHIDLQEQSIFVAAEVSKNKRNGKVGLNKTIIKLMLELGVFNNPGEYYLFGKNFMPAEKRMGPDQFNKRWNKMRKALNWSDDLQFYSLKDSGIRDLANDAGVVVARDQARHRDISTTNKYIQVANQVHFETKEFAGAFTE